MNTHEEKRETKKVVVHIEDREGMPLERFVFEIGEITSSLLDAPLAEIERKFADFLLKIAITDLHSNPKGKPSRLLFIKH